MSLILGIGLFGGPASSDPSHSDGASAVVVREPYQLVKLLSETQQALLFDHAQGAHVLVSPGDQLGRFRVSQISADRIVLTRAGVELTLVETPDEAPVQVISAAHMPSTTREISPHRSSNPGGNDDEPLDPYGEPADPYRLDEIREVLAPPEQRASLQPAAADDATRLAIDPAVVHVPPGAPPPPTRTAFFNVPRRELESALSDFGKLEQEVGFTVVSEGILLGDLGPASYFSRLGFHPRDVITAIDGRPLRGLDDAAAAYARIDTAESLTVDISRGDERIRLRLRIR